MGLLYFDAKFLIVCDLPVPESPESIQTTCLTATPSCSNLFIALIAIFLIPLFIDFKKGLKEAPTIFDSKKEGGKKRSKHLY